MMYVQSVLGIELGHLQSGPQLHRIALATCLLLVTVLILAVPLRANAGVMITDTIAADGRIWAQPDLFLEAPAVPSWYAIEAVCPAGVCAGDWHINGVTYDMNGWIWAAVADINSLYNYYLGAGTFGSEPQYLWGAQIADVFFADGWRPTHVYNHAILLTGWTRTTSARFPDFAHVGEVYRDFSSTNRDAIATSAHSNKSGYFSPELPLAFGGWFYRNAEVPLPSSLPLVASALLLVVRRQIAAKKRLPARNRRASFFRNAAAAPSAGLRPGPAPGH